MSPCDLDLESVLLVGDGNAENLDQYVSSYQTWSFSVIESAKFYNGSKNIQEKF